jgi:hypothetical protein
MTDQPQPRPWWRLPRIRLSVRALMLLILVFGCWLGWYMHRVQVQRDAVAAVMSAGGSVAYDWEWGRANSDIMRTTGRPRAPRWLADRVGIDYIANVILVDLTARRSDLNQAGDETLARVRRLSHLKSLWLTNNTTITNAGLAQIKGLTALRSLHLDDTLVSDAGLAHLKGMRQLETLSLSGSRVTDNGVLDLERALPSVQIHREEEMAFGKNLAAAIDDLDFARTQPIRLASWLLAERAKAVAANVDNAEFIATIDALCGLEANDPLSLIKLAQARAGCVGITDPFFSPHLSTSERQSLKQRCADSAIAALSLAVDLGYDNLPHLENERSMGVIRWNLRDHPDYPKLVGRMKMIRPGR